MLPQPSALCSGGGERLETPLLIEDEGERLVQRHLGTLGEQALELLGIRVPLQAQQTDRVDRAAEWAKCPDAGKFELLIDERGRPNPGPRVRPVRTRFP